MFPAPVGVTACVPLVFWFPLQPPLDEHVLALVVAQVNVAL